MPRTRPALLALTLALLASPAVSATAPAAQKPGLSDGVAVPGLCLLGREAVVINAKMGTAATARLQVLTDSANAELTPERAAIEQEAKAIQEGKLSADQQKSRQQALAVRIQALQEKAAQRQQQIDLTRQKALTTISNEAQPVIEAVYKQHGCSVLFNRDAVMAGGAGMDLTADVVAGLDARKTTLQFDLEPLPQGPAPAAAAANAK